MEDTKQHGGPRRVGVAKVLRIEAKADGDALHDRVGRALAPDMSAMAPRSSGTASG